MSLKKNFFMLPNEVFNLMLSPVQLAVLCYLVRCADQTGICYPSIHTVASACVISDNTARKSLRYLARRKIIRKSGGFSVSKFGKPQTAPYVYTINPELYDMGFCRDNYIEFLKTSDEEGAVGR